MKLETIPRDDRLDLSVDGHDEALYRAGRVQEEADEC